MKEKLFKHLLNVTTGAACAAIMVGTMPFVASVPEGCTDQGTEFQTTLLLEIDENEDGISPQNDIDEIETNYK